MADDTFEWVRARLAEVLELKVDDIDRSSLFADDLDADSIDLIEVVNQAESTFGITIAEDRLYDLENVGELVDLIASERGPSGS